MVFPLVNYNEPHCYLPSGTPEEVELRYSMIAAMSSPPTSHSVDSRLWLGPNEYTMTSSPLLVGRTLPRRNIVTKSWLRALSSTRAVSTNSG